MRLNHQAKDLSMRTAAVHVILGVLACRLGGTMTLLAQDKPSSKPADSAPTAAIKGLVTNFYKNWEQGKATQNKELFLSADVPAVGIAPDHRPGHQTVIWQKKAGDLLKEWETNPPKFLEIDSVDVDRVGESLAVARVTYRSSAIKGRAVFTLCSGSAGWRIASLVLETRFNW
jgi:hypothetical protein